MAMGSGLIALAVLAADGPSCSSATEETTTFQVKVLTLDGLDWRTSSYSRLTPVTRQGTSAIWTADKSLATMLDERSSTGGPGCKVVAEGETVFSQADAQSYVAAMDRVADGPINQSSAIAFMPRVERIDARFSVKLAGRKLDQGVLTRVTLEETHVDAMHDVKQTELLRREPILKTSMIPSEIGKEIVAAVAFRTAGETRSISGSVQIPEVSQTRIDGEWLIPKDGVLLISLGVKTVAGDDGKAVARERLAVIEACSTVTPVPGFGVPPMSKLGMPPTPLRSYPRAVDSTGAISDLPPLPESVASADLDRIKPDQPSPQTLYIPVSDSDPALARTSFDAAPMGPNPPFVEPSETTAEAHTDRLKKLQQALEALAKEGLDLDIDVYHPNFTDSKEITSSGSERVKSDGEGLFCPADGKSLARTEMAGGMKLVGERGASLGVSIKDGEGTKLNDSVVKLQEALKNPGKTETTVVPLDGQFSLEIKATLVPTAKATASKPKGTSAN